MKIIATLMVLSVMYLWPSESIAQNQSADSAFCTQLYFYGSQEGEPPILNYGLAADTLKYYVEHCYSYGGFEDNVFGLIETDALNSGAGGKYPGGDTIPALLQWFFKVLYYDTTTDSAIGTNLYYCNDAAAALGCLSAMYIHDSSVHSNSLNGLSGQTEIEKYLLESGKCPFYKSFMENALEQLYGDWHRGWKDTVKDSLLTPWDTAPLPTLQQIGFQILLGPQYAAAHNGIMPSSILGNIIASPDPFENDANVNYTLNVPATLTVEVYNTLGERVATPVPSVFTNNGDYSLTLSGSSLHSGPYYVRFAVPEGEVKTIKVSKE